MTEAQPGQFDRIRAGSHAREFFDGLWQGGDQWQLESSELDRARYDRQRSLLEDRRYGRVLEIGCAAGVFTRILASLSDHVVGVDVSERAIELARGSGIDESRVELRVANVMEMDLEQEVGWDLVVLAETVYYLGWLYPLFDVAWLAHSLHRGTTDGGRLLLVNTYGTDHGLMSPWLVHTYRDVFVRVGYRVDVEETMHGAKEGVPMSVLVSRLVKVEG